MNWRDLRCGEVRPEHVGRRLDALRLGGHAPRPRRARLHRPPRPGRALPARDQPRAHARGARGRARDPQRVRPPRRGRGRRARARRPSTRTCRPARSSSRSTRSRSSRAARRSRSSSTRRTSTRRCACATAGSTCAATGSSATSRLRAQMVGVIRRVMEERRVPRHPDADPVQADAGGRARLPRPEPPPAGPLLRAAAVAADPQAAARDRRLRPLLPDRDLLPGRGSPRRPRAGDHAARRRDGLPRPSSSSSS